MLKEKYKKVNTYLYFKQINTYIFINNFINLKYPYKYLLNNKQKKNTTSYHIMYKTYQTI